MTATILRNGKLEEYETTRCFTVLNRGGENSYVVFVPKDTGKFVYIDLKDIREIWLVADEKK